MSSVRIALLCLLFAAPGVRAAEQPWGDPVEGIQLRLTLAPAAQSAASSALPVDLPLLQVEVRNQGAQSIKYSYADLAGSWIEIDGVTYGHVMATNGLSLSNSELKPGAQAAPILLSELRLNGLNASGDNREYIPTPGPHTVRLKSTLGQFGDRFQASERTIAATSNLLSVVIPAVDPAVERQALIDESVRRGQAYLPFRTLLRKYPDAALSTVQRMLLQEPDSPMTDANLISWLRNIQGEEVNAFLRARLGPDTHPASRSAAIWILFQRGDPLALPAAIAAWRELQTSALSAAVLPDRSARLESSRTGLAIAAGGLITILANSTNVAAIDALARDLRQMPLEVRLSAVGVFLRPETGYIDVHLNGGPASLPDGAAGLAIERLLFASLADSERIPRSVGSGNLQDYPEPRVADLAALVFATRWPARYSFNWDPDLSRRDARIEVIRRAWQAAHPANDGLQ